MHKVYRPNEAPKEYNYGETCPHCDEVIPVVIEEGCYNYKTTCPVCGKTLMLCVLCSWDYADGNPLTGYKECGGNCWCDLEREV